MQSALSFQGPHFVVLSLQLHEDAMPTLGLCMIVKNGAGTLERCLASAENLFDAMVIGDTGSTDGTVEIARACGARVIEIPWRNDFSLARNAVLAELGTDWVLTLDADEELDETGSAWIRSAIARNRCDAYLVQVINYLSPDKPPPLDQMLLPKHFRGHPQAPDAVAYFPSACCRLFRRAPGLAYTGCVHEMVDYQLRAQGAVVETAGFFIHHFGWYLADAPRTLSKRALYCELLARKAQDMPEDTNTLVRYATLLAEDSGDPEQALVYTRRAADIDSQAAGAWLFTGMILRRLGRHDEALDALARVPAWDQPAFRAQLQGDALLGLGRLQESLEAYTDAHGLAPGDRLVAAKRGLLETNTGHWELGLARLREASGELPQIPECEEMLVSALLVAGQFDEARAEATHFGLRYRRADIWQRIARSFAQMGDWPEALRFLDMGVAQFPESGELHAFRVNACVAVGDLSEATLAAERVATLAPTARAYVRYAALLARSGKEAAAAEVFRVGALLFPDAGAWNGEVAADTEKEEVGIDAAKDLRAEARRGVSIHGH
jgi:tetratricopeptide (TPR) repeat protein